jgi:hypothetical protein
LPIWRKKECSMSDRPWLQDGDPSLRAERALLNRLNAEKPPAGSAERGWSALAAAISVPQVGPAVPTAVAAQAAKAGAGVGIVAKIVVGVALTGTAVWSGHALLKSHGATAAPPKQEVSTANEAAPAVGDGQPEAMTGKAADESPAKIAQPSTARPTSSSTTLAEEGRVLAKAHQLIGSGQSQQALEVLRSWEARYPHSVLAPEREVLTIEALAATGASAVARQRAERFLKRNPNSAYATRLQRFVE